MHKNWPHLAAALTNLALLKRRCFFCGEEWNRTFRKFKSATDGDVEHETLSKGECHGQADHVKK
jgi:hypothetical protein